ncbi:MAG: tetratricopeptide repeat protein [Bacteroidota bacterium]
MKFLNFYSFSLLYIMQRILFVFILFFSTSVLAQKPELAYSYFRNNEYEKAIMLYKPLHEKNKIRRDYFKNLLICYQQTENFEEATALIKKQIQDFPNLKYLNIELGYNYQLQDQHEKAKAYYDIALNYIQENPNYVYSIGQSFRENHLLEYALRSYQTATSLNPKINTKIQLAQIYGEKGELENMFSSYLDLIEKDEKYQPTLQRYIGQFITNDPYNESNLLFKKLLLQRSINNPKNSYNSLLSWLYIQQDQYDKALIQERSIYIRSQNNIDKIIEIGKLSYDNEDYITSEKAFQFIIKIPSNRTNLIKAHNYLIHIQINNAIADKDFVRIDKQFQDLFQEFGKNNSTIDLQLSYADFLTFQLYQPKKAIELLKNLQKSELSPFQKGSIKIKQADILVYTDQFNQALILYSQVQTDLKNSILAQEARFKVAQTSYFKGDFEWAQTQLKVLKSSTSQLIANDALDLSLIITNSTENDSIQKALQLYATAELLSYQEKNLQAIDTLDLILQNFKGHPIEDDALFKQAKLFKKNKNYELAENNYLKIITINKESVLTDDAYYLLAKLYQNQLYNPEKAKELYQKIIFDYPSSIYLVNARKQFRKLRGDDL